MKAKRGEDKRLPPALGVTARATAMAMATAAGGAAGAAAAVRATGEAMKLV